MYKVFIPSIFFLLFMLFSMSVVHAYRPHFSSHILGKGEPSVLIVGGIQGDEPGGFSAASLLVTHYTLSKGAITVVPNLNFTGIIKRSRGPHGDMNRKFATLKKNDPEYQAIQRIQTLIRDSGIKLVLNLHDGSGFYRPHYVSAEANPKRWGQSIIIDKSGLEQGDNILQSCATEIVQTVNHRLLDANHAFYLKNTLTDRGNSEMEKSLTWFAVRNNIPAFGIEASKSFSVALRTYYHLLAVEAFLQHMDIDFQRHFVLSPQGITAALKDNVSLHFADGRVFLPLTDLRPRILGTIPLPKRPTTFTANKPILAVVETGDNLVIHDGNNRLTRFKPEWHTVDTSIQTLDVEIDGTLRTISFGERVDVSKTFLVQKASEIRINAIGATKGKDESNLLLRATDFNTQFSIDRKGTLYRVEAYRGAHFVGMFLVRFTNKRQDTEKNKTAQTKLVEFPIVGPL